MTRETGLPALILFDLDGCLIDSEPIALGELETMLAQYGIPLAPEEARARFLGRSITSTASWVAARRPGTDRDAFVEEWHRRVFDRFRQGLAPMAGVEGFLDRLDAKGLDYCIATGSSTERMSLALDCCGLAPRFRGRAYSADAVARGKPEPDLFLYAAANRGADRGACLVIEDALSGVTAAQSAGMRVWGFVGGSHLTGVVDSHGAILRKAGAERLFDRFDAITRALFAD